VPDHSTFSKNRHGRFRDCDLLRKLFETFVTLGYVGSRLLYEIAVYEFKIGREKPLIIAVRSHRGLFSALSGICQ
jgi:hypothetical protein